MPLPAPITKRGAIKGAGLVVACLQSNQAQPLPCLPACPLLALHLV